MRGLGLSFGEFAGHAVDRGEGLTMIASLCGGMCAAAAPVAELVDALELKIEFRKECWFDSGQGHHNFSVA